MTEGFTEAMALARYAVYIFVYGEPVGLRLAMRHPERVSAIISQNGNAYVVFLDVASEPLFGFNRPGPESPKG